jgi:pimeloyl-ACP methyl ester carboxylesterase
MRVITYIVLFSIVALTGLAGCATWNAEKSAPMLGVQIDVDGEKIHVVDIGPRESAKPPVVLIHGASVNLRDMKMALGDILSADRRVILIDRPGRGYSDRTNGEWRLDRQAAAINGVVNILNVEKPIIVGQSLGGAVALSYALQYQDEMGGLVLLAAVSHEWPGGVAWYNSVSNTPGIGFLLRRFVIPAYGQFAAKSGVEESFAPDTPPENYAERSGLALLFRPKDFRSNAADIFHLKDEIIRQQDRYGELTLPVAIVAGASDTTVSPEIHSKTLAGQIDSAYLLLLPDTGHALHHAQTQAILRVIERISEESRTDGS